MTDNLEYRRDIPIAAADRDPSNSDPDDFTAPLDADDDVFMMLSQDHTAAVPAGEDPQ